MRPSNKGMFIDDIEIRERTGDKFEETIAALDANPKTQKDKATWPAGARSRFNVEKWFAENWPKPE